MRNHHSQHRSKIQKIASLVLLAITLTIVTPVLAAYLGPDRTRTVPQPSCDVILRECQYIASKGDYRMHQVDSWSCSNESKPWLSYSNQSSGCDSSSVGDKSWSKKEFCRLRFSHLSIGHDYRGASKLHIEKWLVHHCAATITDRE